MKYPTNWPSDLIVSILGKSAYTIRRRATGEDVGTFRHFSRGWAYATKRGIANKLYGRFPSLNAAMFHFAIDNKVSQDLGRDPSASW